MMAGVDNIVSQARAAGHEQSSPKGKLLKGKFPRTNPRDRRPPKGLQLFADSHHSMLKRHGASGSMKILGCGANGCAIQGRGRRVVKVTEDPDEIALVKAIDRIRTRSAKKPDGKVARALKALGTTAREVRQARGFMHFNSRPQCVGKWCVYSREALDPLDHDKSARGESVSRRVRKALDEFFYKDKWDDPRAFLRKYPEMETIVKTVVGLAVLYGIKVEDIHEQQVGRVIGHGGGSGRPKGTLVLYDGQLFGRLPRSTRARRTRS